jgi:hypothetical protein
MRNWHQTLKNRILLEQYYLPGDLEREVAAFVEHYNHVRYHESLNNLTPADVYFGRAETILVERERIKRATIANRRLQHQAAGPLPPNPEPERPYRGIDGTVELVGSGRSREYRATSRRSYCHALHRVARDPLRYIKGRVASTHSFRSK